MGESKPYPLKEAFANFVEIDSARKVRRTRKADQRLFDIALHFFETERKKALVSEVQLEDLERFNLWLESPQTIGGTQKEAWSQTTIALNCRLLKKFFRKMVAAGYIDRNPAEFWGVPGGSGERRRAMTDQEFDQIYAIAPAWFQPILRLMDLVGARGASIAALNWEHVDFSTETLLLSSRKGGPGKLKLIPIRMFPELQQFMSGEFNKTSIHRTPGTPVFWGPRGIRVTAQEISTEGSRLKKKCGLTDVVLYGLRHRIAVKMAQKGINLELIRQALGHSSITHTSRYVQSISSSYVSDALESIRNKKK